MKTNWQKSYKKLLTKHHFGHFVTLLICLTNGCGNKLMTSLLDRSRMSHFCRISAFAFDKNTEIGEIGPQQFLSPQD